MSLVTSAQWQSFSDLMRLAHDSFEKRAITWKRLKSSLDRYSEDTPDNNYDEITLEVQINHNYMRTWPVTVKTESGDLDRQSVQILINKRWLSEKGYLNSGGYFSYNPSDDYFLINGLKHVPMGDSTASQCYEDDILFTMILKRDDTATGKKR